MTYELKVEIRDILGTREVKRLRKQGFIPGILYGHGEETVPIKIPRVEMEKLLKTTKGEQVVLELVLGSKKQGSLIKELVHDPVTGNLLHVDLQILHKDEKVNVEIPIHLIGTPSGIKTGGVLEQVLRVLKLHALPAHIPSHVELDVSNLEIGNSLHVKDLELKDVKILHNPEETIATVLVPKIEVAPAPPVTEEVPVTPTEAPAAEEKAESGKE